MQTYRDHLPVLDTLRGLAALLVVFTHVPAEVFGSGGSVLHRTYDLLHGLIRPGNVAIEIFFVLSGFLITRILLSDRARGKPIRHFLIRRFLRIFPIYYLFLCVMLVWHPWSELRWCFAYLSNFYYPFHEPDSHMRHTWSLAVEEHYYLLWAFAVYGLSVPLSRGLARYGIFVLAAASTVVILRAWDTETARRLLYMASMVRIWPLALGSALAYVEQSFRERPRRWLWIALFTLLGSQLVVHVFLSPLLLLLGVGPEVLALLRSGDVDLYVRALVHPFISAGLVLGCVCLHDARGVLGALLRLGPLRFIGRISYGWYLFHVPLFAAVFHWRGANLSALALAVLLSVAAASASFHAIERPILRLKERFG